MTDLRSPAELRRLAERYARYLREPTAMPYLAWGRLGQIIRALHPTQAFDLACHLIRELAGSYVRSFGSATLAHLIHHHGATLIDWIERESWRDVDFLEALSSAWIAREDLDAAGLARLRLATGARIHVVTPSERDAEYRAMFERWITRRPGRRIPGRKRSPQVRPSAMESIPDRFTPPHPPPTWPPTATDPFTRLQVILLTSPSVVRYMLQGALLVWLPSFRATAITTRLLLPTLVVVLSITSASPVTDVALVVGACFLATVVAALASLASGVINQRRGRFTNAPLYLVVISLVPYLTIFALIVRTERGLIVAPAVVVGLLSLPFIGRFFRRVRLRLNRTRVLDRQALPKT